MFNFEKNRLIYEKHGKNKNLKDLFRQKGATPYNVEKLKGELGKLGLLEEENEQTEIPIPAELAEKALGKKKSTAKPKT